MKSSFNLLQDKVALITGCNRGIGKGILDSFMDNGAIVYAIARKKSSLDDYLENANVIPVYMDINDKSSLKELFLKIKKTHGRLDVLVNNAGVMEDAMLGMITDELMLNTFSTNVFAPIKLIQYATKLMIRQKCGSIINMASIMGISGNSNQIVYAASKGAVIAMTKSAAKELAIHHIRVNAIAPGVIGTDLLNNVSEEKLEEYKQKIAIHTIGTPKDVAGAALYLASDLSEYVSGQIIGVDGMMSN